MTAAFASWLAGRSAGEVEIAPGVTTPRSYGDPRREHLATRRAGGLFDFSFMGCTAIAGPGALACVNAVQSRRIDPLRPSSVAYTLLLRSDGSVLNDATVWCVDRQHYWVFSGRRSDHAHIAILCEPFDVEITERGPSQAVIAVQGDVSRHVMAFTFPGTNVAELPYFRFQRAQFRNVECWIARLGYSGEAGYEVVVADAAAAKLWQALLANGADAGLVECGFAAIDSLRIEAGHILFARELASPVTPFELGFARFVDLDREAFCGAQALRALRRRDPLRRLTGLLPARDEEPESGLPMEFEERGAAMTSACWSPLLERRIGIGFVSGSCAEPGNVVRLRSGARARVARLPHYDPAKVLARRAR